MLQDAFLVPTRVVRVNTRLPGGTVTGKLQTRSALGLNHPAVRLRTGEIRARQVLPLCRISVSVCQIRLANLTEWFKSAEIDWLRIMGCVIRSWANHFQSSCEYGYGDLTLRLGSVTVEQLKGVSCKMNLGTGCSAFRIEPMVHPPHSMTFDHPPCDGLRLDPTLSYPTVRVKGVKSIIAIDLSLSKVKSANDPIEPLK